MNEIAEKRMSENYQQEIQMLLHQSKICFLATQGEFGAEA